MKFSNRVYDVLKYLAIIVLPAVSTFVSDLFGIWKIPYGNQIAQTITLIATLLGACLVVSNIAYNSVDVSEVPERTEDEADEDD